MSESSGEQTTDESKPLPYDIVPLAEGGKRAGFTCGDEAMDAYFRAQVGQDGDRRLNVCFVAIHVETKEIAGFYTVSPTSIALDLLPEQLARRLPKRPVGCTLLGRLAVATAHQHQGVGGMLLFHAFELAKNSDLGGYALVVDAKHEKVSAFYKQFGFISCPTEPLRLFLSLSKELQPASM